MVFTEAFVLAFVFGLSELFFAVVSSGNDGSVDGRGHSMCLASKMGSSLCCLDFVREDDIAWRRCVVA